MYESSFIIDWVRPVLADELLAEGEEQRAADQRLAEARAIAEHALQGGSDMSLEEGAQQLCRCAGLLLAIAQPHAPAIAREKEADLLTYALRVRCLEGRSDQPDERSELLKEAQQSIVDSLSELEKLLVELQAHPDSVWISSALLGACLDGAAACIAFVDGVIGMANELSPASEDNSADFVQRDELVLSRDAERVVESFGELSVADQDEVVSRASQNEQSRSEFGPASAWNDTPALAAFLERFAALSETDKDTALRGCAWVVSDRLEAQEDARGISREHRLPYSATLIALFGTWERALELALDSMSEEDRRRIEAAREQEQFRGVGRNESCPCGSGKKFKHCHGK